MTTDFNDGVSAVVAVIQKLHREYRADWLARMRGGLIDRTSEFRFATLEFLLGDMVRAGLIDLKIADQIAYVDPGDRALSDELRKQEAERTKQANILGRPI